MMVRKPSPTRIGEPGFRRRFKMWLRKLHTDVELWARVVKYTLTGR
jgi:hypothetical protein